MAITVYRSDDVGAPELTSAAGSLIAVLDACLVSGYGSKAASGWEKAFTDTNRAVYRAASGNRFYLYIDDTGVQYCIARGYRDMTMAADIGDGPFPTTAQLAGAIRPIKSSTTNDLVRPWIIIAGSRAVYVWIAFNQTDIGSPTTSTDLWFFGDFISYLPGDAMNTALIGRHISAVTVGHTAVGNSLTTGANANGHYLASSYLQDGNSVPCACLRSAQAATTASAGSSGPLYPDPITGGLLLETMRITEGNSLVRGHLPGIFNPIHNQPGNHLDTLSGRGALSGTDFLLLYKGGTAGRVAFSMNEPAHWLPPV